MRVDVSDYKNADIRLRYAVKDARDFSAFFERRGQQRNVNVKSLTLTDSDVGVDLIAHMRYFLHGEKADDPVMVLFSGHGSLDSKLDYYFGSYEVDSQAPQLAGYSYDSTIECV